MQAEHPVHRGHQMRATFHAPAWQVIIINERTGEALDLVAQGHSRETALAAAVAQIDARLGVVTSAERQRQEREQLRATIDHMIPEYQERIQLEEQTVDDMEKGRLGSHRGAEDTTEVSIAFHRQGADAFRRGLEVLKEVRAGRRAAVAKVSSDPPTRPRSRLLRWLVAMPVLAFMNPSHAFAQSISGPSTPPPTLTYELSLMAAAAFSGAVAGSIVQKAIDRLWPSDDIRLRRDELVALGELVSALRERCEDDPKG